MPKICLVFQKGCKISNFNISKEGLCYLEMLDDKTSNKRLLFIWDPKSGAYSSREMQLADILANTYNSNISVFRDFRQSSIKVLHPLDYSVVGEILPPPRRQYQQIILGYDRRALIMQRIVSKDKVKRMVTFQLTAYRINPLYLPPLDYPTFFLLQLIPGCDEDLLREALYAIFPDRCDPTTTIKYTDFH